MFNKTRKVTKILMVKKRSKSLGEDFEYVVKREEKSKVCFGSGTEREKQLPEGSRLVDLGPGKYGIPPQTTAMYSVLNRPTSTEGTVLGGRKEKRGRVALSTNMLTPAPCTYNIKSFLPETWQQNRVPFNVRVVRARQKQADAPGVGHYVVAPYKHRQIPMRHSFGGRKILIPAVEMKCGPFNYDFCERCRQKPEGDYWKMSELGVKKPKKKPKLKDPNEIEPDGIFLCMPCYEREKTEHTLFNRAQLMAFKKFRDCSQFHYHDGCEAKVYLWALDDMKKLKGREGYFSLYFP